MRKYLNRLINPFMKWLLRSPFHKLVSRSYMLIRVKGRKSGKLYTTPVQYAWEDSSGNAGNSLIVVTSEKYTWWKNLRGGAKSSIHVEGEDLVGTTEIATDAAAIAAAFHTIYPKMSEEQITRFTPSSVAIRIRLNGTGHPGYRKFSKN